MWILIPARGGSKSVPHKNVRQLGGKPLILHSLDSCLQVVPAERVIVSTDDEVIAAVVADKCRVHRRPGSLAEDATTLDEVAVAVARWLLDEGASSSEPLLTVQPTSPFLPPETIREALDLFETDIGCVVSVREDTHLRWEYSKDGSPRPLFKKRLNRQWLPTTLAETGGLIGARLGTIVESGTRINEPVRLIELDEVAGLDIDTPSDWALAEFYTGRRRIALRADGGSTLGMGHLYRALALYSGLAAHERVVMTRCDGDYAPGADFLRGQLPDLVTVSSNDEFNQALAEFAPDVLMLDILDTTEDFILRAKENAAFVASFEDLGPGTVHSDVVINDLYYDPYPSDNHWYGVDWSILAPQFEALGPAAEPRPVVEEILVTFGGSDPSQLTQKALQALGSISHDFRVSVVLGPAAACETIELSDYGLKGDVHNSTASMAPLMHKADLAMTSAGRTVTELMSQGIPTIAMCQNLRELSHTHASSPFGVVNLGLGEHVTVDSLMAHILLLLEDHELRTSMYGRMRKAIQHRSNDHIIRRIMATAAAKEDD